MSEAELRGAVRRRTFFTGRVVTNVAGSSLDVRVRNLSTSGARLEAYGAGFLPDTFRLIIRRLGVPDEIHEARRVWTRGEAMGVAFAG